MTKDNQKGRRVMFALFLLSGISLMVLHLLDHSPIGIASQVSPKLDFRYYPSSHRIGNGSFLTLPDVVSSLESPVVMLTVNYGFLDLLHNLLFSIQRLRLHMNLVIICEEKSSYKELSIGVHGIVIPYLVVLTHLNESDRNATIYGSVKYLDIVRRRVTYLKLFIENGFDVLYIDADIVLLGDPFRHFKEEADLIVANEYEGGINYCTGFLFLRARWEVHAFLDDWVKALPGGIKGNQRPFNKVMRRDERNITKQFLPADVFVSGRTFRNSTTSWRKRKPQPVLVHANWLLGRENKTDMLKRAGLWFIPKR